MITDSLTTKDLNLSDQQKLKIALYTDFGNDAKELFDWLQAENVVLVSGPDINEINIPEEIISTDGVYYLYKDGTAELFDYVSKNKPTKPVKRIGVVMGSHKIAINPRDLPEQPLTNVRDVTEYDGYIPERDDAVADWNGKSNTEHIKQIGTSIELEDGEWVPSVAELYLIYLNKRSINAALELCGGEPLKNGWYWSSTEGSATGAWGLHLGDGFLNLWGTKVQGSYYVRAVAAFH